MELLIMVNKPSLLLFDLHVSLIASDFSCITPASYIPAYSMATSVRGGVPWSAEDGCIAKVMREINEP